MTAELNWQTETPTEAGNYLMMYRGVKSKRNKLDLVSLAEKPERYNWMEGGLAFVSLDSGGWPSYQELNLHPDMGVVRWARIDVPASHDPLRSRVACRFCNRRIALGAYGRHMNECRKKREGTR